MLFELHKSFVIFVALWCWLQNIILKNGRPYEGTYKFDVNFLNFWEVSNNERLKINENGFF
jgi:hypothetical protein